MENTAKDSAAAKSLFPNESDASANAAANANAAAAAANAAANVVPKKKQYSSGRIRLPWQMVELTTRRSASTDDGILTHQRKHPHGEGGITGQKISNEKDAEANEKGEGGTSVEMISMENANKDYKVNDNGRVIGLDLNLPPVAEGEEGSKKVGAGAGAGAENEVEGVDKKQETEEEGKSSNVVGATNETSAVVDTIGLKAKAISSFSSIKKKKLPSDWPFINIVDTSVRAEPGQPAAIVRRLAMADVLKMRMKKKSSDI